MTWKNKHYNWGYFISLISQLKEKNNELLVDFVCCLVVHPKQTQAIIY